MISFRARLFPRPTSRDGRPWGLTDEELEGHLDQVTLHAGELLLDDRDGHLVVGNVPGRDTVEVLLDVAASRKNAGRENVSVRAEMMAAQPSGWSAHSLYFAHEVTLSSGTVRNTADRGHT